MNSSKQLVFGYGSLLDLESLLATAPRATNVRPARIEGFRRSFCTFDAEGWTATNLDVSGRGFWALGVHPVGGELVNGVVFEVDAADYKALLQRESTYRVEQVLATSYETGQPLGLAKLFVATPAPTTIDLSCAAQRRYLEVCIRGASAFGEVFLEEFADSTWIGENTIRALSFVLDLVDR